MIDLSNFKLLKEDDNHYEVSGPTGRSMKVEKRGLTPRAHETIKKMAYGGDLGSRVDHYPNPKLAKVPEKDRFPDNVLKLAQGTPDGPIDVGSSGDAPVSASKLESQYSPIEEKALAAADAAEPPAQPVTVINHFHGPVTPQQVQQASNPQSEVPQQAQQPQQPQQPQDAPLPGPVPPDSNTPGSPESYLASEKAQEKNLNTIGQAEQQKEVSNVQALGENAENQKNIANLTEQIGQDYHAHYQDLADKVASGEIDPNRWWSHKSTPSKILSAIGMLFGSAGVGLSGHPELAGQAISNAIKNDMDSQKLGLDNKQNLLSKYTDEYKSQLLGTQALGLHYAAVTEGLIKQAAAKSGSQMAMAAANNAIQQLRNGVAPALENISKASVMNKMYQGMQKDGGTSTEEGFNSNLNNLRILSPEMAKDLQEKYVPSVGVAKVPLTPENRSTLVNYDTLSKNIDKAIEIQHEAGLVGDWTPQNKANSESIKNALNVSLNELFNQKRLSPTAYENYKEQIGNIGGINFGGTMQKLKNLKQLMKSNQQSMMSQYGITPFGNNPNSQAIQWANANPNDPRSLKIKQALGVK